MYIGPIVYLGAKIIVNEMLIKLDPILVVPDEGNEAFILLNLNYGLGHEIEYIKTL
jgi:hypothetical protein